MNCGIVAAIVFCIFVVVDAVVQPPQENHMVRYLLEDQHPPSGAVCPDGTPPAVYVRKGDPYRWIVHLQGGGWCWDEQSCSHGSSSKFPLLLHDPPTENFCCCGGGILSSEQKSIFANWTVALIANCDGTSFSGHREDVHWIRQEQGEELQPVYFRGHSILTEGVKFLLNTKGMSEAQDVILTGCSAGGVATILHIDHVKSLLPPHIRLRGLADAAFFLDVADLKGSFLFENLPKSFTALWKSRVPEACEQHYGEEERWMCFFAANAFRFVQTPMFLVQAQYDRFQLDWMGLSNYIHGCLKHDPTAARCGTESFATEAVMMENFRETMMASLETVRQSPNAGLFSAACLHHCMSINAYQRPPWSSVIVDEHSPSESFQKWWLQSTDIDEKEAQSAFIFEDDCSWPCNPSCLENW